MTARLRVAVGDHRDSGQASWDALCRGFDVLGFADATGGDEVFRQLVLARIIEPTSKLDSLRVLAEAGIDRGWPVAPLLAGLLPTGMLRRGSVVSLLGSTSLLWAMISVASQAGAWVAVVGIPEVGALAAAEQGVALDRLALIPRPGEQWPTVVAALLDGVDLLVLQPSWTAHGGGGSPAGRPRAAALGGAAAHPGVGARGDHPARRRATVVRPGTGPRAAARPPAHGQSHRTGPADPAAEGPGVAASTRRHGHRPGHRHPSRPIDPRADEGGLMAGERWVHMGVDAVKLAALVAAVPNVPMVTAHEVVPGETSGLFPNRSYQEARYMRP
jgi:hypothetical protein